MVCSMCKGKRYLWSIQQSIFWPRQPLPSIIFPRSSFSSPLEMFALVQTLFFICLQYSSKPQHFFILIKSIHNFLANFLDHELLGSKNQICTLYPAAVCCLHFPTSSVHQNHGVIDWLMLRQVLVYPRLAWDLICHQR